MIPEHKLIYPEQRLEFTFSLAVAGLIFFTLIMPSFLSGFQEDLPMWGYLLLLTVPVQSANIFSCVYPAWLHSPDVPLQNILDLRSPKDHEYRYIILTTPAVYAALAVITGLMAYSLNRMGLGPQEQLAVEILRNGSMEELLILIPSAVILAPIGEEFCFRYAIFKKLESDFGTLRADWLTALIFAAAHLNLQVFPALFILSLWLSNLYRTTNSLLAPMISHALFNGMTVLLIYILPAIAA